MNILVTGGCGFIGTNLVELLSQKDHNVTILDKLTYAAGGKNYLQKLPNVILTVGDICDPNILEEIFNACTFDAVVHMAAESHVTRSEDNYDLFLRTNYQGTVNVLLGAVDAGVPRIIHFSTDEVYGSRATGYFTETDELRNDDENNYAQTKVLADKWVIGRAKLGAPIIEVRPANNFGPWQNPEKALARWITNILTDKPIEVWDPGDQVRDWLYVKECARAIEFLLEYGELGEAYNISAMNTPEVTNLEMAKLLCAIAKKGTVKIVENPRPGHDERYAIDNAKLKSIGFSSDTDIEKQVAGTFDWYDQSTTWWMALKAEAEALYKPK